MPFITVGAQTATNKLDATFLMKIKTTTKPVLSSLSSTGNVYITDIGGGFYEIRSYGKVTGIQFHSTDSSNDNITEISVKRIDHITKIDYLFFNMINVTKITFEPTCATANAHITDASFCFHKCTSLTTVDLTGLKTQYIKRFINFFYNCVALTNITFGSNFITTSAITMKSMFENCSSLTSLIINFNTSNVTDFEEMFSSCSGLTTLDVSLMDTSSATNMAGLFRDLGSISLNLTNFTTSSVSNFYTLFYDSNITTLDLSSFSVSSASNMNHMLGGMANVQSIKMPADFNTVKPSADMNSMFVDATNLTCLTRLDTTNATDKDNLFNGCSSLTNPNSTSQNDLQDSNGASWVNANNCP